MKKKFCLVEAIAACTLAMLLMPFAICSAQQPVSAFPDADKLVAKKVLTILWQERQKAESAGKSLSVADLMMSSARQLSGTPYVAGTLDSDWKGEELRISLTKTDCILFVETCLNLARTVQGAKDASEASVERFAQLIAATRYRTGGPAYSYSDRIHYTTEWVRRLEGSVLKDMTLELGGNEYDNPISFMSKHAEKYPALSDASVNPDMKKDLAKIRKVEEDLNRKPLTVIPKDKLAAALKGIRSGDIICYVTTVEGLDISHVAIASVKDGRTCFIHASMNEGKVVTDAKTIFEYVSSRRNLSGIKVVRPL